MTAVNKCNKAVQTQKIRSSHKTMNTPERSSPFDETYSPTSLDHSRLRSTHRRRNTPPALTPQRQPNSRFYSVTSAPKEMQNFQPLAEQFLAEINDIERRISQSMPRHHMQHPTHQSPHSTLTSTGPAIPNIRTPAGFTSVQVEDGKPVRSQPKSPSPQLHLVPSHQVKNVPIFTGREGSTICIEDWVRDTKYLLETTSIPKHMQFSTIARYLGGAARKLILNLPPHQQTPKHAFTELKSQFGEILLSGDPLADFYERLRLPCESPAIYSVELEATLRSVEERIGPLHNRNRMLTQQFMRGVRDERVTQRLAPMKPREMTFHELQVELRQLEREGRMAASLKSTANMHYQQSRQLRPYQQQPPPRPLNQSATPKTQPDISQPKQNNDRDVLQDLLLKVEQLTLKVEQMGAKPHRQPYQQRTDQPKSTYGVYICHKCGQEGHIARGCRNVPSNPQGPRPQGKPSEARDTTAQ